MAADLALSLSWPLRSTNSHCSEVGWVEECWSVINGELQRVALPLVGWMGGGVLLVGSYSLCSLGCRGLEICGEDAYGYRKCWSVELRGTTAVMPRVHKTWLKLRFWFCQGYISSYGSWLSLGCWAAGTKCLRFECVTFSHFLLVPAAMPPSIENGQK